MPPRCHTCNSPYHKASACKKAPERRAYYSSSNSSSSSATSTCHTCKKTGHKMINCPNTTTTHTSSKRQREVERPVVAASAPASPDSGHHIPVVERKLTTTVATDMSLISSTRPTKILIANGGNVDQSMWGRESVLLDPLSDLAQFKQLCVNKLCCW